MSPGHGTLAQARRRMTMIQQVLHPWRVSRSCSGSLEDAAHLRKEATCGHQQSVARDNAQWREAPRGPAGTPGAPGGPLWDPPGARPSPQGGPGAPLGPQGGPGLTRLGLGRHIPQVAKRCLAWLSGGPLLDYDQSECGGKQRRCSGCTQDSAGPQRKQRQYQDIHKGPMRAPWPRAGAIGGPGGPEHLCLLPRPPPAPPAPLGSFGFFLDQEVPIGTVRDRAIQKSVSDPKSGNRTPGLPRPSPGFPGPSPPLPGPSRA